MRLIAIKTQHNGSYIRYTCTLYSENIQSELNYVYINYQSVSGKNCSFKIYTQQSAKKVTEFTETAIVTATNLLSSAITR